MSPLMADDSAVKSRISRLDLGAVDGSNVRSGQECEMRKELRKARKYIWLRAPPCSP